MVCGPSGTGKTFLLEALGRQAVEERLKVARFTLEDLGVHTSGDSVRLTQALGAAGRVTGAKRTAPGRRDPGADLVAGQRNSLTCDDVARNSHPAQDLDDSWHTPRGGDRVADDHGFPGQSGGSRATMDTQTGSTPRPPSWSLLVSVTLRAHAEREALSLVRGGLAPEDFESLQADVRWVPNRPHVGEWRRCSPTRAWRDVRQAERDVTQPR